METMPAVRVHGVDDVRVDQVPSPDDFLQALETARDPERAAKVMISCAS